MNLDNFQTIKCCVTQYNDNEFKNIDEVVIYEKPYVISYVCNYNDKKYEGKKTLYAYPHNIEKLALGHIILDCLEFYDAKFTYNIMQNANNYNINLEAKDRDKTLNTEKENISLSADEIHHTMEKILTNQGKWQSAGCFHCATLYHPKTKELIIAEDIGRHNCIDRLKGHCIMHNLDMQDFILFVTARVTASLYKKIRRAGILTIVSKSAITSIALESAKNDDCTLIGFCRQDNKENSARFTVYNKGKLVLL